ncbi:MAG: biotin/lipoyl-binding protein [Minisyncoccia bacterium]|jgi:multidrug resistance efflux pump
MPAFFKTHITHIMLVVAGMLVGAVLVAGFVWHQHPKPEISPQSTSTAGAVATSTATTTGQVTNTATAAKTINITVNATGKIGSVKVSTGKTVSAGEVLFTVDRTDLNSDLATAKQTLASAQAKLVSLEKTASSTASTTSLSDQNALSEAQNAVRTAARNAYIAANNAVNNTASELISSSGLDFPIPDSQLAINLASQMATIQGFLPAWENQVMASSFNTATNTLAIAAQAMSNLQIITPFLSDLFGALAQAVNLSSSAMASDKTMVSAAQLQVSNALSAVTAAETSEKNARAVIAADAKQQQSAQNTSTTSAIAAEQAAVASAQSQVNLIQASTTESVQAPVGGTVVKISVKVGSTVNPQTILAVIST